jgi:hypothetical protein
VPGVVCIEGAGLCAGDVLDGGGCPPECTKVVVIHFPSLLPTCKNRHPCPPPFPGDCRTADVSPTCLAAPGCAAPYHPGSTLLLALVIGKSAVGVAFVTPTHWLNITMSTGALSNSFATMSCSLPAIHTCVSPQSPPIHSQKVITPAITPYHMPCLHCLTWSSTPSLTPAGHSPASSLLCCFIACLLFPFHVQAGGARILTLHLSAQCLYAQ